MTTLTSPGEADIAVDRSTLPGRLYNLARERRDEIAIREKQFGIWRESTWSEYWETVRAVAMAFLELGVDAGDHVAILSDNRPEWVYADLAAQSLGARSVGVYPTSPTPEVAYVVDHSNSVVLVCEDQEQVDKAIEARGDTPQVRQVVVVDPRGTKHYDDPRLMTWQTLLERGRELAAADPAAVPRRIAALDPDNPAMVVYTSGTTGPPKGAMITSRNVTESGDAGVEAFGYDSGEQVLSYLPLCHVAEKIFTLYLPLATGAVVHFGESIDTVADDIREVSPTVFLGVPRIWEKMQSTITVKMQDASLIKRTLFDFWSKRGEHLARRKLDGRWTLWDRVQWKVGDLLVFRPLQERLGLRRCWFPVSGAAPIAPEVLYFFHGLGIPISEGYGQTECAGVSHVNMPGRVKMGTVGTPLPRVECRLAEDGEILVRGPHVFAGYLHAPEATAETVDAEGWLHTGDIGEIDEDDYLRITGRKKDIIITAGGKNLSPEQIENTLKTSPYIKEAVVIGDQRKFVSALIQIDYDNVGHWASKRKITYTSFADLTAKPEVFALIEDEVRKANEHLSRVESVRKFRLLPKELHQDDEELTATQKVRRTTFHDRYAELIEEMY
jgi:long-chain acyl-CoA synthetase